MGRPVRLGRDPACSARVIELISRSMSTRSECTRFRSDKPPVQVRGAALQVCQRALWWPKSVQDQVGLVGAQYDTRVLAFNNRRLECERLEMCAHRSPQPHEPQICSI
jgi:hypothetical protein